MNIIKPAPMRVLEHGADGSILVEAPVLVESTHVDFSRTQGGGPKDGSMPLEILNELAGNFTGYRYPVNVGFDDASGGHKRDKSGPQEAWLEGLDVRGSSLWGRIRVTVARAAQVLSDAWRGFSVEAAKDLKKPTPVPEGWVLTGGIFTNSGAFPVNFQIAATAGDSADTWTAFTHVGLAPELENTMSKLLLALGAKSEDEGVAALTTINAALATEKTHVGELTLQLSAAQKEATEAKDKLTAAAVELASETKAKDLALSEVGRLSTELATRNRATSGATITAAIDKAIDDGTADPAEFVGYKDNPTAWLAASPYRDADALVKALSSRTIKRPNGKTSSGDPGSDDAGTLQLSERVRQELKDAGIDPDKIAAGK